MIGWIRKDRTDHTQARVPGPVHRVQVSKGWHLTLCGRKLRGFGVSTSATKPLPGEACRRCALNAEQVPVQQDAWKRR